MVRSLLKLFREAASDRGGNVAVIFSLALLPLLGAAGLAANYATLSSQRTKLQIAADAGALQAAKELRLAQMGSTNNVISRATDYAQSTLAQSNPQLNNIAINATLLDSNSAVQVTITADYQPSLLKLFSSQHVTLAAKAVGRSKGYPICALALDPSVFGIATLWLQASAKMSAQFCAVQSNSTDPIGLTAANNSSLTAGTICSSGGFFGPRANFSPTPLTDCPAVPDPLASRPAPSVGPCDQNNLVINSGTTVLLPGVYCGGLHVTGGAIVTLAPGVYIMQAGPLTVDLNSTLNGQGVGVYFTGGGATIQFAAASTINLTAPTSGPMAGLLFFEDRAAKKYQVHRLTSDNAAVLLGTIYLPQGQLIVDANSPVAHNSAFTIIVARRLMLLAGPTLVLNSHYNSTTVPVPGGLNPGYPYLSQ